MTNQLLKTLAAKGCDIEKTLAETFMGKEDFYVRMLRKLPANTGVQRLKEALSQNDPAGVFDASHELKGVYSTLGLTPLYTLCSDIVETSRRGSLDGVAGKIAAMDAMHNEYAALVQEALQ